jgi:hypothetical protein
MIAGSDFGKHKPQLFNSLVITRRHSTTIASIGRSSV